MALVPGCDVSVEVHDPPVSRRCAGLMLLLLLSSLSALSHCSSMSGSAVVVGSGMVGVSVAEALARRGCQVRVVDRQPEARGQATPNSSGWINANSKKPVEYQDLNILVRSIS